MLWVFCTTGLGLPKPDPGSAGTDPRPGAPRSISRSIYAGHPGFAPDEHLSGLGPGTAIAVIDLATSGYWERAEGRDRIRD
jgi:hypothetical protein